jgi:hypothetical protein
MQPNTITLAVDVANNATPVNQEYVRNEETINRSTYRGPGGTLQSRNIMQFYRTAPKRSGDYLGSAKVTVKFTVDVSVPNASGSGEVVSPQIGEINLSIPVGTTAVEMLALRQHLIAVLDRDDLMGPLSEYLDI